MKFTKEKLKKTISELLGHAGDSHCFVNAIDRLNYPVYSFYIDSPIWQLAVAKKDSSSYSKVVILTEQMGV